VGIILLIALLTWFAFCIPNPLFTDPTCTIVEDARGNLLAGHIAKDGQWRFPESDSVPDKFRKSILYFEDQYFYYHFGINPISILRAFKQNLREMRIVSGGSTLTMQLIRLSRKGKARTFYQKTIELFQAIRAEFRYSKEELLNKYATHAPFGGNVVGLEAASWRYYGRSPDKLSWGEMTTMAVLPNAPSLIYPGKNQEKLLRKRNRLLDKLWKNEVIDSTTCELAKWEPLPGKPRAIPQVSPHLMTRLIHEGHEGRRIQTTLDITLQKSLNSLINRYHGVYSENEIHNAAAFIVEIDSKKVLAYVGNTDCPQENSGRDVDVITAPRSTGSIMKPFLYAAMLKDGLILPHSLVPDIPTKFGGYTPKNFAKEFDGAVHASEALYRSLNVPAVIMLRDYGTPKLHSLLRKLKLSTLTNSPEHYGLSLILGGAEATLWDLGNAYLNMARSLKFYEANGFAYDEYDASGAHYILSDTLAAHAKRAGHILGAGAIWNTFEALRNVKRPYQEWGWEDFESSAQVAWKTGTSWGHRDAWAIGMNSRYLVAVWVGNADGEGRPGLTGLNVAAPILFKALKQLPRGKWFDPPYEDMVKIETCSKSGYKASSHCPSKAPVFAPQEGTRTETCPFHKKIHLDQEERYQVTSACYEVSEMKSRSWFVLPPVQEWYYKRKDPFYKTIPKFAPNCGGTSTKNMDVIYPKRNSRLFVPRNLDGTMEKTIFEIAHRQPENNVYWHLDESFIGITHGTHKLESAPLPGKHVFTLVDETGESLEIRFEVLER